MSDVMIVEESALVVVVESDRRCEVFLPDERLCPNRADVEVIVTCQEGLERIVFRCSECHARRTWRRAMCRPHFAQHPIITLVARPLR